MMKESTPVMPFGVLVLAAGQSHRFGSDKLMAKMPDNQPMIAHSLKPLLSFVKNNNLDLCVITRPDNKPLIHYLEYEEITYSLCPDAYLGMGHSIAYGIRSHQSWQGWMIALADMPNIDLELLTALLETIKSNPNDIVRPALIVKGKTTPAHPVYFPRRYGYALSKLTGDNGAKSLITQQTLLTKIKGESIKKNRLMDMDTPQCIKKGVLLKK